MIYGRELVNPVIYVKLVTYDMYLEYTKTRGFIEIDGSRIELKPINISRLEPRVDELTDISTTVWSFPKRGSWGVHRGDYRGNWAPQIPRALISMYTNPGDVVLDPMIGSGTTCIEARLLGRNCIGVDINYDSVILTLHRLYYLDKALGEKNTWIKIYHGDAGELSEISDSSIDLVAIHPPYWNIINYSEKCTERNLSCVKNLIEYLDLMKRIIGELYRVLKPGRVCGVLIGDTRIHRHYVPISHHVLNLFLEEGFILLEEVVKVQHKMKTTREVWSRVRNRGFLLIKHEKLYIFRKPRDRGDIDRHRYSTRLSSRLENI